MVGAKPSRRNMGDLLYPPPRKKGVITIGVKPRNSNTNLILGISPLPRKYEYTFSLIKFIGNNHHEILRTNSAVHSINTRTEHCRHKLPDLHVFEIVCTMLASTFPTVYLILIRL